MELGYIGSTLRPNQTHLVEHTAPARVRFGGFDFDLRTGELLGPDQTVQLGEKPFRVLAVLVEGAGKLVTREEIQKKLWPNDTIVDFEHGINTAIKVLRRALGDSADEPKYIETITRRGYRFMVPVEWIETARSPRDEVPIRDNSVSLPRDRIDSTSLIGKKVSHYRVLEVIGGGGMGMVYEAEDLKLGRRVALKFLPEEMLWDTVALQRFEREARAASSLDHSNICTIYAVEEHLGQPFIVMQLLQGETLRDRLAALAVDHKKLTLDELLDIAIQICDGLQAAHDKGIIHRDIKPANIFLTSTGQVKILDFGLAKLVSAAKESESDGLELQPDGTAAAPQPARLVSPDATLTRIGAAMGTAGYMSPEQVRGEKLDARTDLFSFGLVLYEMATGQRAFSGETATSVHEAVLHKPPIPARELNRELPSGLEVVINKALEKDREKRCPTAADVRTALYGIRAEHELSGTEGFRHAGRWLVAVACLLTLTGALLYWRLHDSEQLTPGETLVVAAFENHTSDAAFDDALKLALESELGQTPFLDVLSPDKVRGALKLMNQPEDERLTPALAGDVCVHTNSAAVVTGSINDEGNDYRIELKAANCTTGKTFASASADAKTRAVVVRTLGNVAANLRAKLGEPAASLARFSKPLDEATSSSIEALQAFSAAEKARMTAGPSEALPLYKQAFDLDPNFALAGAYLGIMYGDIGNDTLQSEYLSRALQLRERTGQRDRFTIEASYYHMAIGDLDRAASVYKDWLGEYPRDLIALTNLGTLSASVGRYAEAEALFKETIRIDPNDLIAYQDIITTYINMNRLDDAVTALGAASSHNVEVGNLAFQRFRIAFLQNDDAEMTKAAGSSVADPVFQHLLLTDVAMAAQYHGRLRKADELWQNAENFAGKHDLLPASTNEFFGWRAIPHALSGNSDVALRILEGSAPRPEGEPFFILLTMALVGDGNRAASIADEISREHPADTLIQNLWLPSIRAAVELQRAQPRKAIIHLEKVLPYENSLYFYLIPAYLRGLAYLNLGQGQQAATEFQKIPDHPGIALNSVTGALAHLQLGRAQVMMGDKAAARRSYQDFLTLWKDADPEVPIYKEAKAEYAKLD